MKESLSNHENLDSKINYLIDKFESQSGPNSIESMVHNLKLYASDGKEMNIEDYKKLAIEEPSFAASKIKRFCPDLIDREILISSLEKKYLDPKESESKKREIELKKLIESIDNQLEHMEDNSYRGSIDQGYQPRRYKELLQERNILSEEYWKIKERSETVQDLIDFITMMNDAENDKIERKLEEQKYKAYLGQAKKIEKERIIKKFEETKILVPSDKYESGQVELSLKEYMEGIASFIINKGDNKDNKTEVQTRIQHLKANFQFHFHPLVRTYIIEKYLEDRQQARNNFEYWKEKEKIRELTEPEKELSNKAAHNFRKANIILEIVDQIVN